MNKTLIAPTSAISRSIAARNNVSLIGKGSQVLLFAHGFGCSQKAWRRITDTLTEDYKLVLFDYVGAGDSQISAYDPERYSTLDGYADDILEICDELQLKDVVLIGHSVSAMISILASIKKPSLFSKLILICPSPCYINEEGYNGGFEKDELDALLEFMNEDLEGWSEFLSPKLIPGEDNAHLVAEMENNFCKTDPEILKQFATVTFCSDNRKDLPKVTVPSLTLQTIEDIAAPVDVGNYILKNTPGNTLKIMKANGHCPHMSAPVETVETIIEYLSYNKLNSGL